MARGHGRRALARGHGGVGLGLGPWGEGLGQGPWGEGLGQGPWRRARDGVVGGGGGASILAPFEYIRGGSEKSADMIR